MKKLIFFLLVCLCFFSQIAFAKTYTRNQLVFGNVLAEIKIETSLNKSGAFKEIEKGFKLIRKIDQIFSTYKIGSELSDINALSKPVYGHSISDEMANVLRLGIQFTKQTKGYFDITFESPNDSVDDIVVHDRSIDILKPYLKINPTGLVKGYTVDQILLLLKKNSRIHSITVALGGDIGHFDREQKTVSVSLFDPMQSSLLPMSFAEMPLANQAVSTSGFYERGRHIKNTTGSRIEHLQVSVVADECVISDALATAMMFMPNSIIRQVRKQFPISRVIVVEKDGRRVEL